MITLMAVLHPEGFQIEKEKREKKKIVDLCEKNSNNYIFNARDGQ
jgi:hypothetical protein